MTAHSHWIRNAADERAAANGYTFDESKGQRVVDFFKRFLRLYEGEYAGQSFIPQDWQADLLMRAFGWVKYSDHFKRYVRRFRKVCAFVPKKNGKSPLGAGVGLFLLVGDGEKGQKVFSAAKDGKQARIMHEHAMRMVQLSPSLTRHCRVNQTTGRIAYLPTASSYSILAGDNIDGQEGLNGSVVIDETHVVDDRLARVLEYMGASRAESMQFEISTAGNNPHGYGKRQWDYGTAVNAGQFPDDQFCFVSYSAPQDATDEELRNNQSFWQNANPSWGTTINPEEFAASIQRAQRSLTDWVKFKMYRLNIWSASANPWLKQDDWHKCGKDFTADELKGFDCYGGLDLSKTRDMSAFCLVFKDKSSEAFYLLPFFWMPEDEATSKSHLVPYLEWARDEHLELTPGNVIDYSFIERRIAELHSTFNIKGIAYDKTYAEELTQRLQEQHGIPRFTFTQSWRDFAPAVAEFERQVIGGKLLHNNHPILNWQAGHIQVKSDANQNKRPVKPPNDEPKKIDGMVAAIMALSGLMQNQVASAYTGERGLLTL